MSKKEFEKYVVEPKSYFLRRNARLQEIYHKSFMGLVYITFLCLTLGIIASFFKSFMLIAVCLLFWFIGFSANHWWEQKQIRNFDSKYYIVDEKGNHWEVDEVLDKK